MREATPPLSWNNFRASIFVGGQERVHRMSTTPLVEIFGDGVRGVIGLWLEVASDAIPDDVLRLSAVRAHVRTRIGLSVLELSVSSEALYRPFYYFAVAVAERVEREGVQPITAVMVELQCIGEMLEVKAVLSTQRQVGLLGELLVVERLLSKRGPGALSEWIGPLREPHDFRIGAQELEVKTTTRSRRIHVIDGTEQLVASSGCALFLVSILLGPPGNASVSLSFQVQKVAEMLGSAPVQRNLFGALLERCGYSDADSKHYARPFSLRRPMAIIRVDSTFPAIARPMIQAALGASATRIESLQYEVNVEGIELEEGHPEFSVTIPG